MKKWVIGIFVCVILILSCLLYLAKYEIILGILIIFLPFFYMGILIGLGLLFYFVGKKVGGDKAIREIKKELNKIDLANPYLYFRDIPNKYGIGVSTIILNIKICKKDILAAILDLCAKGYIKFKQDGKNYEIVSCHKNTKDLLNNELYLLNWAINKTKIDFSIKEWRKLCVEDVTKLGFGSVIATKEYKPLFNMDTSFAKKIMLVSFLFSLVLVLLYNYTLYDNVFLALLPSLFISLFLMWPVFLIVFFIMLFVALLYEGKIISYNHKRKNTLDLTEMGKNEYHELISFAKFLDDFGRFADKHVEEIVVWEQYLSYAILFGFGKKILNTGYDRLKINDNFIIEDLDKIIL